MRSVPDVQPSGCHPPGIRTTTRLAPARLGIRDETSGVCGAPERTHPISAEARLGCFWVAGQSTHGLGRAGVGISVKGRVTPDGDHSLPPLSVRGLGFNAFVSGPHRLRGTLPYGHQPHCPPQQQRQRQPYARGGVVDRIPQVTPDSPRPSPVIRPLPRESPRGRAGARTFSQHGRCARGVNIWWSTNPCSTVPTRSQHKSNTDSASACP